MDETRTTVRYLEGAPSAAGYNRLRRDAGWVEVDPDAAEAALPRSCYAVCAFVGDDLVGAARVVGDGGLCFYVQDVIVLRSHQGRGIGAGLMERVMAFLDERSVANTYVGLMSAVGKEGFYERYGFTRRPTAALGCGMTQFWTRPHGPLADPQLIP